MIQGVPHESVLRPLLFNIYLYDLFSTLKHINVSKICSKASRKLTVLDKMSKFLTFEKRKTIIKTFFDSQFKYCPLIWMFHNQYINNKVNSSHEKLWE